MFRGRVTSHKPGRARLFSIEALDAYVRGNDSGIDETSAPNTLLAAQAPVVVTHAARRRPRSMHTPRPPRKPTRSMRELVDEE